MVLRSRSHMVRHGTSCSSKVSVIRSWCTFCDGQLLLQWFIKMPISPIYWRTPRFKNSFQTERLCFFLHSKSRPLKTHPSLWAASKDSAPARVSGWSTDVLFAAASVCRALPYPSVPEWCSSFKRRRKLNVLSPSASANFIHHIVAEPSIREVIWGIVALEFSDVFSRFSWFVGNRNNTTHAHVLRVVPSKIQRAYRSRTHARDLYAL